MTIDATNLSPARDAFIGRSGELEQLEAHLRRHRLVTVLGEGGSGKTRLVRQFGAATEAFEQVWFCELLHADDGDDLMETVAETLELEVAQSTSAGEVGEAMAGHGKMLVILDNLEQIVEPAARAVDTWLERAPNVRFLATSREPLRIRGEIRVQLEPLEPGSAVELFAARAREQDPEFELDDDRRTVEQIADRLDGLPLAIELAASRITLYAVDELRQRLEASIEVLRSDSRSVEQRHRTMQDAIAWSWELLEAPEREALAEASVFVGGFGLEAAREILLADRDESVAPIVESLVDKSLVRRVQVDDHSRFDLLEPIREFAADKLTDANREAVERRHARHYTERTLEKHRPMPGHDVDNVVAGFWNIIGRDAELGARAALASYMLLRNRGSYPKIREIVERVPIGDIDRDAVAAKLRGVRVRCLLHDGLYNRAPTEIEQGLQRAEAAEDPKSEVFLYSLRARIAKALGKPETARENLETALDRVQHLDDQWLEATLRGRMADVTFDRGEFAAAEKQITETRLFCRTHGVDDVGAHALTTEARFHLETGDRERAEELLEQAMEVHPGGEEWFRLKCLVERGFLEMARGDLERAGERFERALEQGKAVGNRRRRVRILYGLGELYDELESADPEEPLLEILEIVEGSDDLFNQVQARTRLAALRLRAPRYPAAESLLEEAYERASEFETSLIQNHVACWLAVAAAGAGEVDRAEQLLEEAEGALEEADVGPGLVSDVEEFFRPVVAICGAATPPDRSRVAEVTARLSDASTRCADRPGERIWWWRCWDHCAQLAEVLEAAVTDLERANPDAVLRAAADGSRLVAPGGDEADLRSHQALQRIFRALAELRADDPEAGYSTDDLVDIGWPDDVVTEDAGKARVYTAIRNLRSAGLEDILENTPEGYRLDPDTPFAWLEE